MLTHFGGFSPSQRIIKEMITKVIISFMGRVVGFEPTHNGTTIRGLNHLTKPAISISILSNKSRKSSAIFLRLFLPVIANFFKCFQCGTLYQGIISFRYFYKRCQKFSRSIFIFCYYFFDTFYCRLLN